MEFLHNVRFWLEFVGYLGSALVIVSMLMTSIVKLRIVNTVGSVIFCAYAFCIRSYPTAAMQICLIIINVVNLFRLKNPRKNYSAVSLSKDDKYLSYFISEYASDIKKFFPEFSVPSGDDSVLMLTCSALPVGIVVFTENENAPEGEGRTLELKIDYTTPQYRDCSAGKFLLEYLKKEGVSHLKTKTDNSEHKKYLKKLGYTQSENGFVIDL